jgi:hypothetical protein
MSRLADVAPLGTIASAWGNEIRDEVVTPFTNAAQRASQWTSPHEGAFSYLQDTNTFEYWNGSAWTGLPGGSPTGAAGGVLGGTYPNPSFAVDMATQTELNAEATLARNADNLTSGTVADVRIASTIARDSEVSSAITTSEAGQVRDGDTAGGVLGGTYPNPSFAVDMATQAELDAEATLARNADNLTSGTVADVRIAATIARDSEVTSAVAAEATLARNADNLTSGTVADVRIASTIARDSEVSSAITTSEAGQVRDGDTAGGSLAGTYPNPSLSDAELNALAGLTSAADKAPYFTGSGTAALYDLKALGRAEGAMTRDLMVDANKTIAAGTSVLATSVSLSTSRTITLPAANAYAAGQTIKIIDEIGAVNGANILILVPAGADTINGGASAFPALLANDVMVVESNGSNRWTVISTTNHSLIQNLGADTHAQYPNISAQRSNASQTFEFGSASGGKILMRTTSHATKGRWKFGSADYGPLAESIDGVAALAAIPTVSSPSVTVPAQQTVTSNFANTTQDWFQLLALTVTSDATLTSVMTLALPTLVVPDSVWQITWRIVAFNDTDNLGSTFIREAAWRSVAGTVTQIGTTVTVGTDHTEAGGVSVTNDISANVVRFRVTGTAAKTVKWSAFADAYISQNLT